MALPGQLSYDVAWVLAAGGRVYIASDADQNDRVTGQTSFANTTPTFLLNNPSTSTVVCIPFYYQLTQTGTVAGGAISIETEARSATAYASGGTSEGVSSAFFGVGAAPQPVTLSRPKKALDTPSEVPPDA